MGHGRFLGLNVESDQSLARSFPLYLWDLPWTPRSGPNTIAGLLFDDCR